MSTSTTTLNASHLISFLACLLLIAVLTVIINYFTWSQFLNSWRYSRSTTPGPFSLSTAYHSYSSYPKVARNELLSMRASYGTLGRYQRRIGYDIGYPKKLDRLQELTDVNAKITRSICKLAHTEFQDELRGLNRSHDVSLSVGRVRESLKHFVRDWSDEGKEERETIFAPILDVLQDVNEDERSDSNVLVPGSGLGRLAWEISQLGFNTTANELSFYPNLALRFLLSPTTTTSPNQHTIHPFAHWFSHQRSNASLFRGITFPDVIPRLTPTFHVIEQDFLRLSPPGASPTQSRQPPGYDFVITLFFIDTSLDVVSTIAHIYKLLRPGGSWINLGPLLWTAGAETKMELSLEEVISAAECIGFIIDDRDNGDGGKRRKRKVECEYTRDNEMMMRWVFHAEFWVARK